MQKFKPPSGIKSPHTQNILTSTSPRQAALYWQHREFLRRSKAVVIDCGDNVRLSGEMTLHSLRKTKPLLTLFHGWEGSSGSAYVVSAAATAFRLGFNVFRLNFRDHNNTHHLNRGIFNSSLIEEVVNGVCQIQAITRFSTCHLAGFSLGANFALRVGIHARRLAQPLDSIVAVCPVIDPQHSTQAITTALPLYESYFCRKWKKSLRKKLNLFPEYNFGAALGKFKNLNELNAFFIPRYTGFATVSDYFRSYTLSAEDLVNIEAKTLIIASNDDPIIPFEDIRRVKDELGNRAGHIEFDIQASGSHCAFLESLFRSSWADRRLLDFITTD